MPGSGLSKAMEKEPKKTNYNTHLGVYGQRKRGQWLWFNSFWYWGNQFTFSRFKRAFLFLFATKPSIFYGMLPIWRFFPKKCLSSKLSWAKVGIISEVFFFNDCKASWPNLVELILYTFFFSVKSLMRTCFTGGKSLPTKICLDFRRSRAKGHKIESLRVSF